jgi:hypothetical protein
MPESIRMVKMKVGQYDGLDLAGRDTQAFQLRIDFIFPAHLEMELGSVEPGRNHPRGPEIVRFHHVRNFARVDQKNAFRVFDDKDPNG